MKYVTNEYRKGIVSNRNFLYEAKITLADGNILILNDKNDLMGDGLCITTGTSGTDSFDIGAAVIGELTLTLNNSTEKFDLYDFLDAQISLKIGLQLQEGAEYLQMGFYTVEDAKTAEATIILSALDRMSWFEKKYSEVTSVYPRSLYWIVKDICNHCGISFSGTSFPGSDKIIPSRPKDKELSCLEMISYAAQIAGCYAIMTGAGALSFRWYDTAVFEELDSLDGGKLKNADTGDTADGGTFTNYNSGAAVDGGTFLDQRKYAHIYEMSSMEIATDEIVITGIRVTANEEEAEEGELGTAEDSGSLYGEEGYVLSVLENPLISKDMEKDIAQELGRKIIGMKIRTFSVSALSDPAIEAGDCAYLSDRKGNSYPVYITNTAFRLGNYEEFSCGAQTPARNRAEHITANTQAIIRARKEIKKQFTIYDTAMQQLTELMANSFGVFKTEEKQPDGSMIYYMHDKPTVGESMTIWKMVSGGIAVSTDGGKSWNAGLTAEGNMIVKVLSAIGINADWINAGEITSATINIGNQSFVVDARGNVKVTKGSIVIGDGAFSVDTKGKMEANNAVIKGTIVGENGFSLDYENTITKPPIKGRFTFAEVGYENPSSVGLASDAYLNIYSPLGEKCIVLGRGGCGEDPANPQKMRETAFFPNGAVLYGAFVESLYQTLIQPTSEIGGKEWLDLNIRTSGVFVCIYGTYHVYKQDAWESREITIGNKGDTYLPTYANVKSIGYAGKRIFVFTITKDGRFLARNASELDIVSTLDEDPVSVGFRFDFVRF